MYAIYGGKYTDISQRQLMFKIFDMLTDRGLLTKEENHRLKLEAAGTAGKNSIGGERKKVYNAESRNI